MRGWRSADGNPRARPIAAGLFRCFARRDGRRASGPRRLLWIALAGAGVALPALSQVNAAGDYLVRMDADADGRVSPDEYLGWMMYAFERMDRDGDGVLAAAELPGGKGEPVTREQNRARLAATFRRQDADRDGYLDARELAAPPR